LDVRPAALGDGPRTGRYRTAPGLSMQITSRISRADVAAFMLHCVLDRAYVRETPAITAGSRKGTPS
jgi:hypothetical protein